MANNCGTGGTVAGLTGQTPDCGDCRGISRITQSADKLSMTIYYTDGTSQVFSLPTGSKGDTGATGADGVVVLVNDISDSTTTGTSAEILKSFPLAANTLATNGSYLLIKTETITTTANLYPSGKYAEIFFNGSNILGALNGGLLTFLGQYTKLILEAKISRLSQSTLLVELSGIAGQIIDPSGVFFPNAYALASPSNFGYFSIGGLNLATNSYDIDAMAQSFANGDITCQSLSITLYNK